MIAMFAEQFFSGFAAAADAVAPDEALMPPKTMAANTPATANADAMDLFI
jgi:hypothetical protein